jgi:peroxiredoxin
MSWRVATLAILLAAAGHAQAADPVSLRAPDRMRPLPSIKLTDPEGRPQVLEARAGTITLLHFWATWCAPCREELPVLQTLPARIGGCDLHVVAVAADRHDDVRQFAVQHRLHLPILIDQYGEAMHALGIRAFPETQVADSGGVIRLGATGIVDWQADDTLAQLAGLCRA